MYSSAYCSASACARLRGVIQPRETAIWPTRGPVAALAFSASLSWSSVISPSRTSRSPIRSQGRCAASTCPSIVRRGGKVKAVVQRVSSARVRVDGRVVGEIGPGLLVLLGVARGDGLAEAERLAGKTARLRIFEDADGKFDRSVLDAGGSALVVSQFTLIADTARGNRPSFSGAARPEEAEPLYEAFAAALRAAGVRVETGVFGARMEVEL